MRLTGVATIAWGLGPDSCSTCRFFPHHATRSSRRPSVPSFTGHTPARAANFRLGTHWDMKAVVNHILAETYEGLDVSGRAAVAD
jgi:hypothetical protein